MEASPDDVRKIEGIEQAIGWLDDQIGQSYKTADAMVNVVVPFAHDAGFDAAETVFGEAYPASEARGIVYVGDDDMILSVGELSGAICEAIGLGRDDSTMLGHGSTYDVRHDENVETLRSHYADIVEGAE